MKPLEAKNLANYLDSLACNECKGHSWTPVLVQAATMIRGLTRTPPGNGRTPEEMADYLAVAAIDYGARHGDGDGTAPALREAADMIRLLRVYYNAPGAPSAPEGVPGPRLGARDLAKALDSLASNVREILVVNDTGSGSETRPISCGDQAYMFRTAAWTLRDQHDTITKPIPMRIVCPGCGELHIDEGEFATKPHHTHACQKCGEVWRPAVVNTVGVRFLPGFKDYTGGVPGGKSHG